MKQAATWEWEIRHSANGATVIAGIDEVGRGAWAGPLVACAYVFTVVPSLIELFDSKLLTETDRLLLLKVLTEMGEYGIGESWPQEIDTLGLQTAQYLAYERAINNLSRQPEIILLDGRPWYGSKLPHEAIVGGDKKVASIAAASIVAKVHRDTYMKKILHNEHPEYGFNLHVGYGTALHKQALKKFGVLSSHRQSYKPIQALLVSNQ